MVTFDTVRAIGLALPGVVESTSYGTPALKVGKQLLVRLHQDGETLVVIVGMDAREMLLDADPEVFFVTDHYAGYPAVLVRLARVKRAALAAVLEEAHRALAPSQRAAAKAKPAPKAKPAAKAKPITPTAALERVRALCLSLPGAAERAAHGRPGFEVRGKTFVMFMDNHHGDGRLALWCKAPPGAQQEIVGADPARFFVPPYLGPRGWIGVRLDTGPDWGAVEACVREAHGMSAPRRKVAAPRVR
jgi:hypothetical protein